MINGRLRPDLKDKRRREARERQDIRDKRTSQQQLSHLDAGDFVAKKERKKLAERIK